MKIIVFVLFVTCAWPLLVLSGCTDETPAEASSVIQRVSDAAQGKDFDSLRKLMIDDFQWSFGGDLNAGQAIEAWQKSPELLSTLRDITAQPCADIGSDIIECPEGSTTGYRAGFRQTDEGWRMVYFLAGD